MKTSVVCPLSLLMASWMARTSLAFMPPSSVVLGGKDTRTLVGLRAGTIISDTQGEVSEGTVSAIRSVNYFICRACNYRCKFCFHTQKNKNHLDLVKAKKGLALLRQAGTEKINFVGGEPFLNPVLLGELCKYSAKDLGLAVGIISNGSMITSKWMNRYGDYVDILGVSVDSFNPATNAAIGRGADANNKHADRVFHVRDLCYQHGIAFKMNTVVCSLNWQEDMREHVKRLDPARWKAFQVLVLEDENSGGPGELRDARPLQVTDDQFWSFVNRHNKDFTQLIPQPNDVMQCSYGMLDEELRFLDSSAGGKTPTSESILEVGVEKALQQVGFDPDMFVERGGIYDWWSREKTNRRTHQPDPQQKLLP